jgi:hypothetical protein
MIRSLYPFIVLFVFSIVMNGCTKTEIVEIPVEVEKKNSWTELKGFIGKQRIMLSSGSNSSHVFIQQPFFFTDIMYPQINLGITMYGANLPTDLNIRIPIAESFFVYPFGDIAIMVKNNLDPITSPSKGFFNLQNIDTTLTKIRIDFLDIFKCFAINKNNELLLNYENNLSGMPYTFMILGIQSYNSYPFVDTLFSRKISIPRNILSAGVRSLTAIEDFFLVEIFPEGLYKIKPDGSYSKVYAGPVYAEGIYEWKGNIYAHQELDKVLVSPDKGNNWQQYNGSNPLLTYTKYFKIKDSLIGAYNDKLFTLDWNGSSFKTRPIQVDGLEGCVINGIEILNDTIYAATTSGLYLKPASSFFESAR